MRLVIDHLAVAGETLDEAAEHVGNVLGVHLSPGGVHVEMGTHNRLLSLGPGCYLEAIAINPDAASPERPRWFDLDRFEGPPRLTNWIAATDDLAEALADAPEGMGVAIPFSRGDYLWQMAVPGNGRLPFDGAVPALIQWDGAKHPADALEDRGCRLHRLEVAHPDPGAVLEAFPALQRVPHVVFTVGERVALRASIDTPHGRRVLE